MNTGRTGDETIPRTRLPHTREQAEKPPEIKSRQTKLSSSATFTEGKIKSRLSSENIAPWEEQRAKSNQKTQHEQKNERDSRSGKSYGERIDQN
jgi:hypothetical protein